MEDDIFCEEPLQLPPSSSDLPVPHSTLLSLVSVYKILVEHYNFAQLVFEDFCAALAHQEHCSILSDVHIALLDVLLTKVCVQ